MALSFAASSVPFAQIAARLVLPAALAASFGIGALFSLGVVFVQDVLDASEAQFGVLIALFGIGAPGGPAIS